MRDFNNIFLCGFMGCGKSTIGKLLAEIMDMTFVDLDEHIEAKTNMTISQIFDKFGEQHFRKSETEAIAELCEKKRLVVATGGGALTFLHNYDLIKQNNNLVLFLKVNFNECYNRIKGNAKRPIVQQKTKDELNQLFNKRIHYYQRHSDLQISGSGSKLQIAYRIKRIIQKTFSDYIYLDNASTTKPSRDCILTVTNIMQMNFGNASSLHRLGLESQNIIQKAKKEIACSLGCERDEIYFTSGATESNNIAILGGVSANKRAGNKIVVSAVEHPSVMEPVKHLKSQGFEVVLVPPDNYGVFHTNDFLKHIDNNTILVSVMAVNNEMGTILPFEEIFLGAKRINPKIITHTDFVQAYLKQNIKLKKLAVDLLSISGHKVFASKGIGALYIKKGTKISPITFGGGQQNSMRTGTEPTELIGGFSKTVSQYSSTIEKTADKHKMLNEYLKLKLSEHDFIKINSGSNCANHIVNFSVLGLKSEVLLHFLEQKNIFVSSGSACSKGKISEALKIFIPDKNLSDCAIRVSFCPKNKTSDIDKLIENIILAKQTLIDKQRKN